MRQHSIDLLPSAIRARGEAGLRAGRFVMAAVIAVGLLLMVAVHSMFALANAQDRLYLASIDAGLVSATEARAAELKTALSRTQAFIDLYENLSIPVNISAVMATVINHLPPSVTLDQFDIDAGARTIARTARTKGVEAKEELAPRVLSAEVSGFAATDQQIAELVSRLSLTPPLRDVNLDFSRTRAVNGRDAREFRLSFKIDLDAKYDVVYHHEPGFAPGVKERAGKELANVQ